MVLIFLNRISLWAWTSLAVAIAPNGSGFAQGGVGSSAALGSDGLPAWAFLWDPSVQVPTPTDTLNALPGSNAAFSWKQARDLFVAPDWHPDTHPAMPDIVANGRKPDIRACGSCHRVEGTGGPEMQASPVWQWNILSRRLPTSKAEPERCPALRGRPPNSCWPRSRA